MSEGLPILEELCLRKEEPDTELHWMQGPPIATPEWVVESWKKAAAAREAKEPTKSSTQ